MHNLNTYLNLTTTLLVSSLTVLAANPGEAATWSRTLTPGNDIYSDTNNPTDDALGSSQFIQVGNFNRGFGSGDEQRGYLSWNLDSLIAQIPAGSQIRNVSARLIMTQSSSDPNNPNDPERDFPSVTRVTLDGLEVTGDWNEGMAINPANPPNSVDRPTLFSGQIDQGQNDYSGIGLNRLVSNVLNSNFNNNPNDDRNVLSIALRANNSLNFPDFGVFPVDSFWSKDQANPDFAPRLELDFDVWNEAHRIVDGPNFAFYSRAGGDSNVNNNISNGDWELSLGTKSIENGKNKDNFRDQSNSARQLTWRSGVNVPFQLACDTNSNQVTLTLPSGTTSFPANNCGQKSGEGDDAPILGIDGLKIFAQARETTNNNGEVTVGANTTFRIIVNQVREIGGTLQNVAGLSAVATAGGTQFVEDNFYFLDSVAQGGLGFTSGIDLMRGTIRMVWPTGAPNPQAENVDSRIQAQLIPLIRVDDPGDLSFANFAPQLAFLDDFDTPVAATQPASSSSCSEPLPSELWQLISDYDSSFLPDDNCGSFPVSSVDASGNPIVSNQQSVPEPTSVLAFILLGSTGMGVRLLKK